MPVEALWRWLREDVTYHHCHAIAEDLIRRVAAFEADVNANPCAVADRLWVKDHLDPEEEKLPDTVAEFDVLIMFPSKLPQIILHRVVQASL